MAETPSQQSPPAADPAPTPTPTPTPNRSSDPAVVYWCYQCEKRVSVETQADLPDVVCDECKSGFVECIARHTPPSRASDADENHPSFDTGEILQVLRLIAQAARDDDVPPPPPAGDPAADDNDYLRIELDGWDEVDDEEEDNDEANEANREDEDEDDDRSDEEDEEENENVPGDDEDDLRRRRREVLRLRLRDFASRAASRRNRILDWAEILMGLEDHSIEFRLQVPDGMDGGGGYIGNPGDYVDAAGYEALLQNLAESDTGGRRGAPPAAKSTVEALQLFEVKLEKDVMLCAICKDMVNVGEVAKMIPCGHGYHGDCIVPWLGSRNSCPVCRYELPTDDPEYEEDKKKRTIATAGNGSVGGGSSSSSGDFID